ncbi:MAG: LCP family protein [Acidimicrobiia bacterium]|nr:LCP family protein [Acidimicrobiia bacterium]
MVIWFAVVVLVAGAAWFGLSAMLFNASIERIPRSDLLSLDATSSGPVNYLLVGSDSREDVPEELGGFFGDFAGQRADVIMVAHVADGRLQLLSLPRDLKVDVPGEGVNKINAAYALGGPDLLVRTVRGFLGMPIHHYVEVGFGDFANVVDRLGGVDMDFPFAARDIKSGLSVEAGTTALDGPSAIAFVRSRSYEELQNGSWVGINQSDIGRMGRQQLVLNKLMTSTKSPSSLLKAPWLASGVGDSLTADEGLSMFDLTKLGWALMRSGGIDAATLPVTISNQGGVSYVVPIESEAARILSLFANGQQMNPEPAKEIVQ